MNALLAPVADLFGPAWPAVWTLAKIVAIVLPIVLCVAYLTLAERRQPRNAYLEFDAQPARMIP